MTSDAHRASGRAGAGQAPKGRSLRWRLTKWYAGVFGLSLALVAAGSLVTMAVVLERRSDRYLRASWRAFATELLVEASEIAGADSAIAMTKAEVNFEDTQFVVTPAAEHSRDALSSVGASGVPHPPEPAQAVLTLSTRAGAAGGTRLAVGTVEFHARRWTVVAEHPRAALRDTIAAVSLAYAFALPLLLGIALAGGYALARRALAPVAAMGRQARAIEAATLHDRLPVDDPHDELGELAVVINALLARLEVAFEQQRRLVADASHELRTPVAVLLAEADVLLSRQGRPETEYRERVGVLRDAADRLARLVDDLFLLTRADNGQLRPRRELLYFDEVVSDAVRAMEAVASRREVQMQLTVAPEITATVDTTSPDDTDHEALPGAVLEGDPRLLDRLLLNLLDNAIKYSPAGAQVTVTLDRLQAGGKGLQYVLRVADAGPGIPPEAQPFVFDRFFRADEARARALGTPPRSVDDRKHEDRSAATGAGSGDPGSAGLGLAIARWVAEVHGGTLELERSSPAGTTMRLTLPANAGTTALPYQGGASGS